METENNVVPETTMEVVPETTENVEETTEETIDWEARAKKAEELALNQKIRAEKAERKAKEGVKTDSKPSNSTPPSLSTKDLYALVDAKVSEEDISEVEDYARFKGISISEALKTPQVKATLALNKENRLTAQASNTGTARRSSTKTSDEVLSDRASKGELPDSSDDLVRLIKLRKNIK